MQNGFHRRYKFSEPLDDAWELMPEADWTFKVVGGAGGHFANTGDGVAATYLRSCCLPGDSVEFIMAPGAPRSGVFRCGWMAGFEYAWIELDLVTGDLQLRTHEFHKQQPRLRTKAGVGFHSLKIQRERDVLPGLPYEGSRIQVLLDDRVVASVGEIDLLPETLLMFGLHGKGEITLTSLAMDGPTRPRPEFVNVGIWQCSCKPHTAQNVDALIEGVRQAAGAGVEILLTPETSLTGLRPDDPELADRDHIQSELRRFQQAVAAIPNAPYTLIGYPDWIPGAEVEGATLPEVKVNSHRFVRPDGTLGPPMAKVHSCEEGLWHGRHYNLQRVAGVEVAFGVCHDGHYSDVWATGVMAGARLCMHAAGAGGPADIPDFVASLRGLGSGVDAFWVRVNAGGGSGIVYPISNRKQPNVVLATPADLTTANPTYPKYSTMGDQLAHARLRLWDATGCYPVRTLRAGSSHYAAWQSLMPEIQEV